MAFLYATSAYKIFFLKAMSENLNQKRKYIKIQNLNLNKTNFKIFSFKLLFFFLFQKGLQPHHCSLFYRPHLSNPNHSQVLQWPLQTPQIPTLLLHFFHFSFSLATQQQLHFQCLSLKQAHSSSRFKLSHLLGSSHRHCL